MQTLNTTKVLRNASCDTQPARRANGLEEEEVELEDIRTTGPVLGSLSSPVAAVGHEELRASAGVVRKVEPARLVAKVSGRLISCVAACWTVGDVGVSVARHNRLVDRSATQSLRVAGRTLQLRGQLTSLACDTLLFLQTHLFAVRSVPFPVFHQPLVRSSSTVRGRHVRLEFVQLNCKLREVVHSLRVASTQHDRETYSSFQSSHRYNCAQLCCPCSNRLCVTTCHSEIALLQKVNCSIKTCQKIRILEANKLLQFFVKMPAITEYKRSFN